MAYISTEGGVFTVGYDAATHDGKVVPFQNCYTPCGEAMFEHREDTRSLKDIYFERLHVGRSAAPAELQQGIFKTAEFLNLLAFVDKMSTEESVFLNWRTGLAGQYQRLAIGVPFFYTRTHHSPFPCMSGILFHEGVLALAWVRPMGRRHELVLTRVPVAEPAKRKDEVLEPAMQYITQLSAANIGPNLMIVGGRGIWKTDDALNLVYFSRFEHLR